MSISKFQDQLDDMVASYKNVTSGWTGDILECNDCFKDIICFKFLINAESWWDDILPPIIINQSEFIQRIYDFSDDSLLSNIIRDDIYLYLEGHLREMVQQSFDKVYNAKIETFAGYEAGQ